jgi:hypothetical protein
MTFNCKFETPCGWCEKFDKSCKEVCGTPKHDRFKSAMKISHNPATKQETERLKEYGA